MKGDVRKQRRKEARKDSVIVKKIIALKRIEEITSVKFTKNEKWKYVYHMGTREFYRWLHETKQLIGYSA